MESWELNGFCLEYYDKTHQYLINGIEVPSITQIIKTKFDDKYKNVPLDVLKKASEIGTMVHKQIEDYCKFDIEGNSEELQGFKKLKEENNFEVIDNELPIIICIDNIPICAGRLDLVLKINDDYILGDIKRTYNLDKEYLKYQLNLYKIGYEQCYKQKINGLKALHLRNEKRKFVDIQIDENYAFEIINKYLEEN